MFLLVFLFFFLEAQWNRRNPPATRVIKNKWEQKYVRLIWDVVDLCKATTRDVQRTVLYIAAACLIAADYLDDYKMGLMLPIFGAVLVLIGELRFRQVTQKIELFSARWFTYLLAPSNFLGGFNTQVIMFFICMIMLGVDFYLTVPRPPAREVRVRAFKLVRT